MSDDRIALATEWLDSGEPPAQERMTAYWARPVTDEPVAFVRIAQERREHDKRAGAHADATLGYTWSDHGILSDETEAWQVARNAEYDRLEASAREQRIEHLASLIDPA